MKSKAQKTQVNSLNLAAIENLDFLLQEQIIFRLVEVELNNFMLFVKILSF